MLHDWARKDRHRKLHVIASWASNIAPILQLPTGVSVESFEVLQDGFYLKEEDETLIARFTLSGWESSNKRIYANPNLSIDIAVDEAPPPCHDIDTLNQRFLAMKIAVGAIVDGISETLGYKRRETSVSA